MSQPFVDPSVKKLLNLIYAPMYTKTLFAAIELNIFSELEENLSPSEVAAKLNLHPENTKHLLDALTGMALLEKEKGHYRNTRLASKYLVKGLTSFIGDHLRGDSRNSGFEDIDLVKLTQEGPPGTEGTKKGFEFFLQSRDWTEMLKAQQRGGRAQEIADLVSVLPEFSSFKKMLDLGGGPGLIGLEIVSRHPDLQGVIFDTDVMGQTARESIKELHLENRAAVMTGDFLQDSIGEGYDLILAIGVMNFAKSDLDAVVRKIYTALNPKGIFICISEGLTHEGTQPKEMVVAWLPTFLQGFDFSLEQGEVSEALLKNDSGVFINVQ